MHQVILAANQGKPIAIQARGNRAVSSVGAFDALGESARGPWARISTRARWSAYWGAGAIHVAGEQGRFRPCASSAPHRHEFAWSRWHGTIRAGIFYSRLL